jgi:hypothetical protein
LIKVNHASCAPLTIGECLKNYYFSVDDRIISISDIILTEYSVVLFDLMKVLF